MFDKNCLHASSFVKSILFAYALIIAATAIPFAGETRQTHTARIEMLASYLRQSARKLIVFQGFLLSS